MDKPLNCVPLEENIRKMSDIGLGNDFMDMIPYETNSKIDKRDYIKLKSFCKTKGKYQHNEKATYSI